MIDSVEVMPLLVWNESSNLNTLEDQVLKINDNPRVDIRLVDETIPTQMFEIKPPLDETLDKPRPSIMRRTGLLTITKVHTSKTLSRAIKIHSSTTSPHPNPLRRGRDQRTNIPLASQSTGTITDNEKQVHSTTRISKNRLLKIEIKCELRNDCENNLLRLKIPLRTLTKPPMIKSKPSLILLLLYVSPLS